MRSTRSKPRFVDENSSAEESTPEFPENADRFPIPDELAPYWNEAARTLSAADLEGRLTVAKVALAEQRSTDLQYQAWENGDKNSRNTDRDGNFVAARQPRGNVPSASLLHSQLTAEDVEELSSSIVYSAQLSNARNLLAGAQADRYNAAQAKRAATCAICGDYRPGRGSDAVRKREVKHSGDREAARTVTSCVACFDAVALLVAERAAAVTLGDGRTRRAAAAGWLDAQAGQSENVGLLQ